MLPYSIIIESESSDFWRYNIVVMGEALVAEQRVDFVKYRRDVADVGANLSAAPAGISEGCRVELTTKAADSLILYIYCIPHSLPITDDVDSRLNSELLVSISNADGELYRRRHVVSAWSGCNIEVRL